MYSLAGANFFKKFQGLDFGREKMHVRSHMAKTQTLCGKTDPRKSRSEVEKVPSGTLGKTQSRSQRAKIRTLWGRTDPGKPRSEVETACFFGCPLELLKQRSFRAREPKYEPSGANPTPGNPDLGSTRLAF